MGYVKLKSAIKFIFAQILWHPNNFQDADTNQKQLIGFISAINTISFYNQQTKRNILKLAKSAYIETIMHFNEPLQHQTTAGLDTTDFTFDTIP